MSPQALIMLWNYAIAQTASVIVAGFARVKKCSSEGRALMALDLQVLYGSIRHLALRAQNSGRVCADREGVYS